MSRDNYTTLSLDADSGFHYTRIIESEDSLRLYGAMV